MKSLSNRTLHRKMWKWIADNIKETNSIPPVAMKGLYFRTSELKPPILFCYACEETSKTGDCKNCPCNWEDENCVHGNSIYEKFNRSKSPEETRKYALKIMNCWPVSKKEKV